MTIRPDPLEVFRRKAEGDAAVAAKLAEWHAVHSILARLDRHAAEAAEARAKLAEAAKRIAQLEADLESAATSLLGDDRENRDR